MSKIDHWAIVTSPKMTTDSKCYHMTIHLQYFLEKNVPPVADTENNWNISGKRTSCWTTYARYRIWIVWTLVGKSIPSISTTSFTAKYAGVQMGWHCFKIVSSYQRTPSVDSGCPPLPSGPSNNSRTSSVHHGSAKMEKTILKRLTVNSGFSWWKSHILETQFQPGINKPVRLHRLQIPGHFYFLICLSDHRLSLYPFPPKSIFSYSFNISPSSGSSLLPSNGRRFGF